MVVLRYEELCDFTLRSCNVVFYNNVSLAKLDEKDDKRSPSLKRSTVMLRS